MSTIGNPIKLITMCINTIHICIRTVSRKAFRNFISYDTNRKCLANQIFVADVHTFERQVCSLICSLTESPHCKFPPGNKQELEEEKKKGRFDISALDNKLKSEYEARYIGCECVYTTYSMKPADFCPPGCGQSCANCARCTKSRLRRPRTSTWWSTRSRWFNNIGSDRCLLDVAQCRGVHSFEDCFFTFFYQMFGSFAYT